MNWLQTQVQTNPKKLFIQHQKNYYSYLDVFEMVRIYSKALLRQEIRRNDRVVIYLPSGIDMVEIILACFEIGAVAAPISENITKKELQTIVNNLNPSMIISNWNHRKLFSSYLIPISCIEDLPNLSGDCAIIESKYKSKSEDICAIILTSGATGIPKAVQLTYANFETSCNNWNTFLEFQSNDQFLCCLPLNHIGGLAVLIRGLLFGFSINLLSTFDAEIVNKVIRDYPISIISLVPTMLKRILSIDGGLDSLKSLRFILLGGGPSPESLLDLCIQEKLPIIKVYGMTETCSGTFGLKVLDEPQNKLFAGRPFPGTKVWTENEEIHISGQMVMKGYLNERETQGAHNSHDLGYLEDDNLLFLHIRRKDLIITGGENVNPIEVEEHLINIDGIYDAAVIGKADNEWGQRVIAYIVQKSTLVRNEFIERELKKSLSKFKIPKEYIRVPLIPRNELGKLIYEKLGSL